MNKIQSPDNGSIESKEFTLSRGMPTWSEHEMFFRVRTQFRILVILSVIAALIVMIWVIQKPIISAATRDPSDGDIASALIPVLAAALSINLFIGMGINFVEQNRRTMVAYLGHGMRWLKNAEVEVQQARQFLTDASDKYQAELFDIQFDQTPITQLRDNVKEKIEAADELVVLAKKHLETAENNLDHLVDSRNYQRVKWSAISYFSILLGLLISAATSLQIFSIMGVQLDNPKIDMILTGLLIGGLVYPVHQVIGNLWEILTNLAKR